MKMKRILAASTAALLAFGTTAAYVASAYDADDDTLYEEITKDGVEKDATSLTCTGITKTSGELSVSASVASNKVNAFKGYYLQVDLVSATPDTTTTTAVSGAAFSNLTTKQQNEITSKLAVANTVVLKVALAKEKNSDGDLKSESKAPAPITFEISGLKENVHVYHLSKNTVEEVPVTMDATIGQGKTATFEAQNFSDFIISKDELKKGVTSADDAAESDASAATSTGTSNAGTSTTNPDTGIALAIAPVVLAAGAVAVVALKKKH